MIYTRYPVLIGHPCYDHYFLIAYGCQTRDQQVDQSIVQTAETYSRPKNKLQVLLVPSWNGLVSKQKVFNLNVEVLPDPSPTS